MLGPSDMADSIPIRIRRLLTRSGVSQETAAKSMGYSHASGLQRYLSEEDYTKEYVSLGFAKKLAAAVVGKGNPPVTENEVLELAGVVAPVVATPIEALPGPAMPSVNALPVDVPVLGTAVGGSAGDFSLNGQIMDYVRRPPGMARNRNIFCIFLSGESMHPRLEHGELLYINPNRPARPGEDVLVEMLPSRPAEPGAAYVKQLEAKTPTKLILKQFNPPGKMELPLAKILRISPIMRNKELMGV